MKIKTVVKVMNFHSLLRVDSSRRQALKFVRMEKEITEMIDLILNNRNLILDKHVLKPKKDRPELIVYIGSDYSFCAGINSQVNGQIAKNQGAEKILIGKKLRNPFGDTIISFDRDNLEKQLGTLERIIEESIGNLSHRKISVVYNHYYNAGKIELTTKQIFPITIEKSASSDYIEDFVVEGNIDELLTSLTATYVNYEIRIASINSYASENIMRQNATTASLEKIEEKEEEDRLTELKEKKQESIGKILDRYVKKRAFGGKNL